MAEEFDAIIIGAGQSGPFLRFFRKKTGMTPGRYRVTQRGQA